MRRLLTLLLLLSSSALAQATDLVPPCTALHAEKMKTVKGWLEEAENSFHVYRQTQISMRRLYYEKLWEARQRANDPLSKEKRESGKEDEKYFLTELARLEKISEDASTTLFRRFE